METSRLYKIAEKDNVSVDFCDIPHSRAFCISLRGKKYIAMDKQVAPESAEERVLLAHEIGHIKTDSLYSADASAVYRKRQERRADAWAIAALIPLPSLKSALKNGVEGVSALAEYFSVTEEFMQKAIMYYSEVSA